MLTETCAISLTQRYFPEDDEAEVEGAEVNENGGVGSKQYRNGPSYLIKADAIPLTMQFAFSSDVQAPNGGFNFDMQ